MDTLEDDHPPPPFTSKAASIALPDRSTRPPSIAPSYHTVDPLQSSPRDSERLDGVLQGITEEAEESSAPIAPKKIASDAFVLALSDHNVEEAERLLKSGKAHANRELWTLSEISPRIASVKRLFAGKQAKTSKLQGKGKLPLLRAVKTGHLPMVRLLLDHGANPNAGAGKILFRATTHEKSDIGKLLLERGADYDVCYDKVPMLIWAICRKNHAMAMQLVTVGANLNVKCEAFADVPALSMALILKQPELVKHMLENGADANALDPQKRSPLIHAARLGYLEMAEILLLYGAHVDARDSWSFTDKTDQRALPRDPLEFIDVDESKPIGYTALVYAAVRKDESMVALLLKWKANLDKRYEKGFTVVLFMVYNKNLALMRLLVEKGADIDTKDDSGNSPLHMTVWVKSEDMARVLIEHGVEVDSRDVSGFTPLMWAAVRDSVTIAELLINAGADVRLINDYGRSALMVGAGKNCSDSMAKLLIKHGAEVNAQDPRQMTALMDAVQSLEDDSSDWLAICLLDNGADVNLADKRGRTALMLAIRSGTSSIAERLLERHADVSPEDEDGDTALHYAVQAPEAMKKSQLLLSKYNADVTVHIDSKNHKGHTPLVEAIIKNRPALVELLLRHRASLRVVDDQEHTPLGFAAAAYLRKRSVNKQTLRALLAWHPDFEKYDVRGTDFDITPELLRDVIIREYSEEQWVTWREREDERRG